MTNPHRSWRNALIVSGLCAVLTAVFAFQTSAQDSRSGQWILDTTGGTNQYHLTLNYRSDTSGRGNNITSYRIEPDRLQGLTGAQIMSAGSQVQFQLVRDAGTFNCEGWFKDGKGSGHFVFSASPAFASELQKRGISAPTEAQQFSLAMHDVSLAFVDELNAQGYERHSVDQLVRMIGFQNLTIEQLVRMQDHGVTPAFIKKMRSRGFTDTSIDELRRLADHGFNN